MSYSKITKMKYKAGDTIRFLDTPNMKAYDAHKEGCIGLTHILTKDKVDVLNRDSTPHFALNKWAINFIEGDFELISETKITNDYELY